MNGVIGAGIMMQALTTLFYIVLVMVAAVVVLRLLRVSWPWIFVYALIIFTVLWRSQEYLRRLFS